MLGAKTLALGLLMTGTVVVPAFAGSIRPAYHHVQHARESLHPAPSIPVVSAPSAIPAAMPRFRLENQAGPGAFSNDPAGSNPSNNGFGFAQQGNQVASAAPAPSAPAPSPTPLPAPAAAYTAPAADPNSGQASSSSNNTSNAPQVVPSGNHAVAAFINFGSSNFSEASTLTSGTPTAWFNSPVVQNVFGGTPNANQQAGFISEVLQTVQHTYALSGLNVSLTTNPSADYAHTLSVVSGASYNANPNAIGITDIGNDGFSLIDKFGAAKNSDELATAIGHNIAHELMHAFGLASHPDQTGTYLDAATASWSVLTNPSTMFSPQASQMLSTMNFLNGPGKEFTQGALGMTGLELLTEHHPTFCNCPYCQALRKLKAAAAQAIGAASAAPVPEPATLALWGIAGGLAIAARRRGRRLSA